MSYCKIDVDVVHAEIKRLKGRIAELQDILLTTALWHIKAKTSCASLATAMGWKLHNSEPNKMKALRCIDDLKRATRIKRTKTGHWKGTKKGAQTLANDPEKPVANGKPVLSAVVTRS